MWGFIKRIAKEEEGTETVEWAILAALLLVIAAGTWTNLGSMVVERITTVVTALG